MQSWIRGMERLLKSPKQSRPQRHARPTLEGLEERAVPTMTTASYTAQFVQGYVPAASVPVLTFFNDKDVVGNANNYSTQISWGDGTTLDATSGAVLLLGRSSAGSTFQVFGNHTYAHTGSFSITVTIHDQAGSQSTVGYSTAIVETANQHFVQEIYPQLLNRAADASGFAHFTAALNNGASRFAVVQEIQNSGEYHALVVQQMYKDVFGRSADTAGLKTWTKYLAQGNSEEQLKIQLLGSGEYFAKHGSSNADFLQAIFQDGLHRNIDPSGAQVYAKDLNAGKSRAAVAAIVLGSTEASRMQVQSLYHQILGRDVDSAGLSTWSSALLGGQSKEQVAANLLASDEFFAHVGPVSVPNVTGIPSGL